MEQNKIKEKIERPTPRKNAENYLKIKGGRMVSFRMPKEYVEKLKALADATGKSKSEVLRSGLDALQAAHKAQGGQAGAI